MEFINLVKERYSCKNFDNRQIEKERLDRILEVGRLAPTAKNNQNQRIYVAQSEKALEIIDKETPCRYNASTVLVIAYDKDNVFTYPGDRYKSGIEDATIVATHMLLASKSVGVDSCWVNLFNPDKLRERLNLPENEEIVALIDLGYAKEGTGPLDNHFKRKDIKETVDFI